MKICVVHLTFYFLSYFELKWLPVYLAIRQAALRFQPTMYFWLNLSAKLLSMCDLPKIKDMTQMHKETMTEIYLVKDLATS